MVNYQVLFSGDVAEHVSIDGVRDNLARELGLDERKARQLFSGRTVVIRSQLDRAEAQAWQDKLARFGAICRIKDLTPKNDKAIFDAHKSGDVQSERTLRDITAAHLECPRCSHMQLDTSHCARCGVDLVQAFKQQRKEDLLIDKKIRELRTRRENGGSNAQPQSQPQPLHSEPRPSQADATARKKGMLGWFKK